MLLAADLIKLSILVSQFSIKLHNFAAMLKSIIIVAIGSGIGGVLRFLLSKIIQGSVFSISFGTMTGNILGCLLIGILYGLFDRGALLNPNLKLLLTVGFVEDLPPSALYERKFTSFRSDNILYGALYAGGSVSSDY